MTFIIQQILPHYRYEVLKYLPQDEFKVLFSNTIKEGSLKSVETVNENFISIPIIKLGEKYFQFPFKQMLKEKPDYVVVTPELRNLSFWILFLFKFILSFKLVSWTHGINNADYFKGKISFAGRLRILMMRCSDQIITYSKDRAEVLASRIDKRITVANNTLDSPALDAIYFELTKLGRETICENLDWSESDLHFIYVGRLIMDKNITESLLLYQQIAEKVRKRINFHIVGDGPYRQDLENFVEKEKLSNVYFYGQIIDKHKLGSMLYASDFHLHLGYTGLAIVHSLCFACPVVTKVPIAEHGPYHSPEYEYLNLTNSITGSFEVLVDKVIQTISEPKRINKLKQSARSAFINNCSIDHFLQAFNDLKGSK